jgi:hypothetical protein
MKSKRKIIITPLTNYHPMNKSEQLFNKLDSLATSYDMHYSDPALKSFAQDYLVKFYDIFAQLFTQCIEDNFYWEFCPFNTYEATFERRLETYLKRFFGSSKTDFYKSELNLHTDASHHKPKDAPLFTTLYLPKLYFGNNGLSALVELAELEYYHPEIYENVVFSQKKKIEFLNSLIVEMNKNNDNPFPKIFTKKLGYNFFEALKESLIVKEPKNLTSNDYNFVFTSLKRDGFIHEDLSAKIFTNWLDETYSIHLLKIKDGYGDTIKKKKLYTEIKQKFKTQIPYPKR